MSRRDGPSSAIEATANGLREPGSSPTGRAFISAGESEIRVWDSRTGADELVLRGQGGITGLDLGATGKPAKERACTGSSDGSLRLWDLDHPPEYRRISASAGRALDYLQFLRSLRTPSHSVPSVPDQYTAFAFHPKAPRIIALTLGLAPPQMSHLHIWDLETWTIARAFDLTGSGSILAIRPDGLRAAVAAPGGIALLDLETGKVVRTLKSLQTFQTLTFSPDGRRVAATGNSVGTRSMRRGEFLNEIQIWDEATGEELRRLRGFDFTLDHLAFHPDGRRLLGRGGEQTIHVWDVATGSKLAWGQAAAGLAPVSPGGSGLALDREGRRLLTSDGVYDAGTGKRLLSVGGSAFSPDGTRIAAVGKILEAEAGRELLTLPVPSGGIRSAPIFSHDASYLALLDRAWNIVVWDATPRTSREARSVVELLFAQKLPAPEVLAHPPRPHDQRRGARAHLGLGAPGAVTLCQVGVKGGSP